jgi:RNA polymerase sigma factor (sigma-70 family)
VDGNTRVGAQLTNLYEAHAADAFRFALHLTGRREDAEDVVQHVFLQAYAVLEEGHQLLNPRAWLLKATKHRSLNLIRDRRDTPSADIEPPPAFAPDESEAEALAQVRAALWSLPEPQHQAFVLRHWSGLSQDEIADVLATTPGAVESLLVRARAALVAEREEGDTECVGVRGRLARMIAPTPAQSAHLAGCRRCRTAQTRLLRAGEFAASFALVPGPHVLHTLSAAIPGFGASGAVASASATGAAAGTGSSGAAVSAVSAATKAGVLTKVAVVATTAAVAVTAVHPLRAAVEHEIFRHAPATSVLAAPRRVAVHPASATAGAAAPADESAPVSGHPGLPTAHGGDPPTADGGAGATSGPQNDPPARGGGDKGKSGSAGSNGNGTGNAGGNGQGKGRGAGATHGKSGTAPGRGGAPGAGQAKGAGKGKATGAANGNGANPGGGGGAAKPSGTKPTQAGGGTTAPPTRGSTNANGNGAGKGNAGGNGNGAATGNAGGNGNGKP